MVLTTRTLADAVAQQLREAIVTGELRPGQPLWQEQLAERFGVSRVPIREALRHLAAEGLVTMQSHRSACVTSLSRSELEELIVIASALDTASVERAIPRLTTNELDHMKDCLVRMQKVMDRPQEWLNLNVEFHLITIRASGWPRLESLIIEARRNLGRYVLPMYERAVEEWDRQHGAIYKALLAGNEEQTKREIQAHWQYTMKTIGSSIGDDGLVGAQEAGKPVAA